MIAIACMHDVEATAHTVVHKEVSVNLSITLAKLN